MEVTEQLAHNLLVRFAQAKLSCTNVIIGRHGYPIVVPNYSIVVPNDDIKRRYIDTKNAHPLLLIDGKAPLSLWPLTWEEILNKCLGCRISWYDSYKIPNTSAQMPNLIEQLMIELDLTA